MSRFVAAALVLSLGTRALAVPLKDDPPAITKSPELSLSDGKLAYQRGDYSARGAHAHAAPLPFHRAHQRGRSHRSASPARAVVPACRTKQPEAEEEVTSILALRSGVSARPHRRSAHGRGVLRQRAQKARHACLREAARARAQAERNAPHARTRSDDAPPPSASSSSVPCSTTAGSWPPIPFGVGQFQNGQNTKAALFRLRRAGVRRAVALRRIIVLEQKYTYDPATQPPALLPRFATHAQRRRLSRRAGGQSGIAFWGLHHRRNHRRTRSLQSPKSSPLAKCPRPNTQAISIPTPTIAPIIGANQAGLAVGGKVLDAQPTRGHHRTAARRSITSTRRSRPSVAARRTTSRWKIRCSPMRTHTSTSTGATFKITALDRNGDLTINGRKRKKHQARAPRPSCCLGATNLTFSLYDEPVTDDEAAKTMEALSSYRKLLEFSEKLLGQYVLRRPARVDDGLDHSDLECREGLFNPARRQHAAGQSRAQREARELGRRARALVGLHRRQSHSHEAKRSSCPTPSTTPSFRMR